MLKKKSTRLVFAAVALAGLWYAFRPERLFVDQTVNESFPVAAAESTVPARPDLLASGSFHSNAHETKGMASIYQLPDGRLTLRLTGFETSNGPDVRVYLVAATDVTDNQTVTQAGFIEVGALKGNIGDQNYDLPNGLDLARYKSVTIWCRRFSVNFGTAPLS